MKYLAKALFSALVIGVVACGGVGDDAKLAELSDDDITSLCEEFEPQTKDCGNGVTVTTDPSQCSASLKNVPTSCEATAGDARACNEGDPCDFTSAACGKLAQCASNSGGS